MNALQEQDDAARWRQPTPGQMRIAWIDEDERPQPRRRRPAAPRAPLGVVVPFAPPRAAAAEAPAAPVDLPPGVADELGRIFGAALAEHYRAESEIRKSATPAGPNRPAGARTRAGEEAEGDRT